MQKDPYTYVRIWLFVCILCVLGMVAIGGLTRLTESGLSIVEWKLFSGIFPPLTEAGWEEALAEYRQSPEYQKINRGMNIYEFQRIYWLEYIHRLFGRVTGLVILLPLIFFTLKGTLRGGDLQRGWLAAILVACQGVIGWLMVKSGLIDDPRVAPVRLALHLTTALILLALLQWSWLKLRPTPLQFPERGTWRVAQITLGLLFLQIVLGALVAGWDAGKTYNTWPLMDGKWVPGGLMLLDPWYRNFIDNITMVQFQHRMTAIALTLSVFALAWRCYKHSPAPHGRNLGLSLSAMMVVQFALGVITLLLVVPIGYASLHQLGAAVLLMLVVLTTYRFRPV